MQAPVTIRGIPRFLPTLTEVVPAELVHGEVVQGEFVQSQGDAEPSVPEPVSVEALPHVAAVGDESAALALAAQALVQDMDFQAQLESRVRQIVAATLAAQVDRVTGQLMGELEPAVRQLVREKLAREGLWRDAP